MSTIADKLLYLLGTKSLIRNAIIRKGVEVPEGTYFRDYADKILEIETGGGEERFENMAASFIVIEETIDNNIYDLSSSFLEITVEEVPNVPSYN